MRPDAAKPALLRVQKRAVSSFFAARRAEGKNAKVFSVEAARIP